jgi:hypothetical protein
MIAEKFEKGIVTMASWIDEYMTMVEDCEKRESRLNDWERGFIDSIKKQLEDCELLTGKQIERLETIWEKATKNG